MKREDIKAIEGITDAQLDAIMAIAGRDAADAASAKADLNKTIQDLQQQIQTAQQGLAAFDGVDVKDLQGQVKSLQDKITAQAAEFTFSAKVRKAIREAGAIDEDDVFSLLPGKDTLAKSANQDVDIADAIKSYKEAKPAYFAAEKSEDETPEIPAPAQRGIVAPKPNPPIGDNVTVADFVKFDAGERIALKQKNPTLFAALIAQMKRR